MPFMWPPIGGGAKPPCCGGGAGGCCGAACSRGTCGAADIGIAAGTEEAAALVCASVNCSRDSSVGTAEMTGPYFDAWSNISNSGTAMSLKFLGTCRLTPLKAVLTTDQPRVSVEHACHMHGQARGSGTDHELGCSRCSKRRSNAC